jgi:hypothetical protein
LLAAKSLGIFLACMLARHPQSLAKNEALRPHNEPNRPENKATRSFFMLQQPSILRWKISLQMLVNQQQTRQLIPNFAWAFQGWHVN